MNELESVLQEIREEQYDDSAWSNNDWAKFILEYLPHPDNPVPLRRPEYGFRKLMLKVAALAVAAAQHRPKE